MGNNKLRDLREDNDYTQQQIADILGMQKQQYYRYEKGVNEVQVRHLKKLCLLYKVSADYILDLPKGLSYPER